MDPLERPDLLTPREAANVLGITVSTIANLSRQGQITALPTPGGHRRYTREEIDRVKTERNAAQRRRASAGHRHGAAKNFHQNDHFEVGCAGARRCQGRPLY